jgi:hypothetical protein
MNLATVAPKSTRKSNTMMQDMMGVGGMWGMGLIGLLLVLVLVLAAAALIKYLFKG